MASAPTASAAATAALSATGPPPLAASAAEAVSAGLTEKVAAAAGTRVPETHLRVGHRYQGKVRDVYDLGDAVLFVATDRLSAFDRSLAVVPLKGAVLNLISHWWFEKLAGVVPNHVVRLADPNAVLVQRCEVFPIEVVVRGFITGTTSTSLWTHYRDGAREFCGETFPDGLRKNDRLSAAVLTPTTKEAEHDRPISPADIVKEGWMTQADWDTVSAYAMAAFEAGQRIAAEHGLLLVDTKYEFGRAPDGTICLVDEVHTPDSSRYWLASTYEARHAAGEEPENIDKEFLRLWFRARCDPYADATVPEAPAELVSELSRHYVLLYEMITGEAFDFAACGGDAAGRIRKAVEAIQSPAEKVVVALASSYAQADRAAKAARTRADAQGAASEVYTCPTPVKAAEAAAAVAALAAAAGPGAVSVLVVGESDEACASLEASLASAGVDASCVARA